MGIAVASPNRGSRLDLGDVMCRDGRSPRRRSPTPGTRLLLSPGGEVRHIPAHPGWGGVSKGSKIGIKQRKRKVCFKSFGDTKKNSERGSRGTHHSSGGGGERPLKEACLELGGRNEGRAGQIHNEVRAVDGRKLRNEGGTSLAQQITRKHNRC